MIGTLIWVGIIFFSVVIHEFGHALTAVFFKQTARIQLIAFGGVTMFEGPKLKFWQQFIITFRKHHPLAAAKGDEFSGLKQGFHRTFRKMSGR